MIQKEPLILRSTSYGPSIDWVGEMGYPVQNQGDCSAGWAFATSASIGSASKIKVGGSYVPLSTEQLVSCTVAGEGYYNDGCNGGSISTAMMYTDDHPLETNAAYPYNS